jgi:ADP-heptose:LPS heptosyltransferase
VVVNINSEASSRRLTVAKAVEVLDALRNRITEEIVLIGAPKEAAFVTEVLEKLKNPQGIRSMAGKTSLPQLAELLASAQVMLTTDSGPAHLANALHTHTVVLFGAGNENNTAPYNKDYRTVIRLGKLSCEPCEKNICVRYGTPQCLEQLDTAIIVETVKQQLKK